MAVKLLSPRTHTCYIVEPRQGRKYGNTEREKGILADMIESSEFPHLVNKYAIISVPKVVINEAVSFEGALPEKPFAEQVIRAIQAWRTLVLNAPGMLNHGLAQGTTTH